MKSRAKRKAAFDAEVAEVLTVAARIAQKSGEAWVRCTRSGPDHVLFAVANPPTREAS